MESETKYRAQGSFVVQYWDPEAKEWVNANRFDVDIGFEVGKRRVDG